MLRQYNNKTKTTTTTITCIFLLAAITQATPNIGIAPPADLTERQLLEQFFNYIDMYTIISLDNMLGKCTDFVQKLLDAIPENQRGDTAEMLKEFIRQTKFAQASDNKVLKAESLMKMTEIVNEIRDDVAKQEPEDMILKTELVGMFPLLASMSIEEMRFHKRFTEAVSMVDERRHRIEERMREQGIEKRNEDDFGEIYMLMHAIVRETSIGRRELYIQKLHQLKERYLNI